MPLNINDQDLMRLVETVHKQGQIIGRLRKEVGGLAIGLLATTAALCQESEPQRNALVNALDALEADIDPDHKDVLDRLRVIAEHKGELTPEQRRALIHAVPDSNPDEPDPEPR